MKRQKGGWGVGVWVRAVHHKFGRGRDQSPPYGGGGQGSNGGGGGLGHDLRQKIEVSQNSKNCA